MKALGNVRRDCCDKCILCNDTFTRSDNSDISEGATCTWTEELSEAFSIASNRLRHTSNNKSLTWVPVDLADVTRVSVVARDFDTTCTIDLIIRYTDTNNYLAMRVLVVPGQDEELTITQSLVEVIGGNPTTLIANSALTEDVPLGLTLCITYSDHSLFATVGTILGAKLAQLQVSVSAQGITKTGLACSGICDFDDFETVEVVEDDPVCTPCDFVSCATCDDPLDVPSQIQLTFTGAAQVPFPGAPDCNIASLLNANTFLLDIQGSTGFTTNQTCTWIQCSVEVEDCKDVSFPRPINSMDILFQFRYNPLTGIQQNILAIFVREVLGTCVQDANISFDNYSFQLPVPFDCESAHTISTLTYEGAIFKQNVDLENATVTYTPL